MKILITVILCVVLWTPAYARQNSLTLNQIERVKEFKSLISDVDRKSVHQTIAEIEKAQHPAVQLQMREAMAHTYVDLVKEQNVSDPKKKEWLYSMIALNMAYLQFGGTQNAADGDLNKLICSKLKAYLPAHTMNQEGFHFSLE